MRYFIYRICMYCWTVNAAINVVAAIKIKSEMNLVMAAICMIMAALFWYFGEKAKV